VTCSTAIPRSGTRDRAKPRYGKIGQTIDEAIGLGERISGMVDQNGDGIRPRGSNRSDRQPAPKKTPSSNS
jgi:hypothetical protein